MNKMGVFMVNPGLIPFLTQSTNIVSSKINLLLLLRSPVEWTVRSGRGEGCEEIYLVLT